MHSYRYYLYKIRVTYFYHEDIGEFHDMKSEKPNYFYLTEGVNSLRDVCANYCLYRDMHNNLSLKCYSVNCHALCLYKKINGGYSHVAFDVWIRNTFYIKLWKNYDDCSKIYSCFPDGFIENIEN